MTQTTYLASDICSEAKGSSTVIVPTEVTDKGNSSQARVFEYVASSSQGRHLARDCSTLDAVGEKRLMGRTDRRVLRQASHRSRRPWPCLHSWTCGGGEIRMHVFSSQGDVLRRHSDERGAEVEVVL